MKLPNKFTTLAKQLWPLNRSLTGDGVKQTFNLLKKYNKSLKIIKFRSGSKVFDWKIPLEWKVSEAWIKDMNGKDLINFKNNNLHLVGYSSYINKTFKFKDLKKNLHIQKSQPTAIPYVTSYYKKNWGFCLNHKDYDNLKKNKKVKVFINSSFKKGFLNCAEIYLPGNSKKEILFSTYICHPSMANNELSGPVIAMYLSEWIRKRKKRKWSYRFVFVPETIGSIAYLSKRITQMKKNIIAGYVLTCVGDDKNYSFLPTKNQNTISDKIAFRVFKKNKIKYKKYDWLQSRSDEIQYCSPGVDLPIASIMRTKYEEYKEYHTSLDTIGGVVTEKGLNKSFKLLKKIIVNLESSHFPITTTKCEPQLGKRGLYPNLSKKNTISKKYRLIQYFLSYSDGSNSIEDIAEKCNVRPTDMIKVCKILEKHQLIKFLN